MFVVKTIIRGVGKESIFGWARQEKVINFPAGRIFSGNLLVDDK
jgi:hypothetical protein